MSHQCYVIVCASMAGLSLGPGKTSPVGMFLESFDPEAFDGFGFAAWTDDLDKALKFRMQVEAAKLWRTVPRKRPRRPDGKPNRPLTAYSIEIIPFAQARLRNRP